MYVLFFFLLILATGAHAARLEGRIFTLDLDPIAKSVLVINSTPEQTYVSKYGGYFFEVEEGTYKIAVFYTKNGITKQIADKTIEVQGQSVIYNDLFMYSDLDLENAFSSHEVKTTPKDFFTDNITWVITVIGIVLALILALVLRLLSQIKTRKFINHYVKFQNTRAVPTTQVLHQQSTQQKEEQEQQQNLQPIEQERPQTKQEQNDQLMTKKMIELLEKNSQTNQKELRKLFTVSEAKISLLLAQLEQRKIIIKIKSGRQNIIRLQKKVVQPQQKPQQSFSEKMPDNQSQAQVGTSEDEYKKGLE